jgi:AcrR family transcriptional regulator
MTDSEPDRRGGKRERLVAAAVELLHQRGVAGTTLADVAAAADVPAGNVYYYFKTKDQLVEAVIDAHARTTRAALDSFAAEADPRARLHAFTRAIDAGGPVAARYGCPHGTLCCELDKREDGLDRSASRLMEIYVDWTQEQFRQLGRADARALAVTFVSVYQGASLLANAFRDPAVLAAQAAWLRGWVDSLA